MKKNSMPQNTNFGKTRISLFPQLIQIFYLTFFLLTSFSLTAQSIWKGGTPGQEQAWNVAKNWSTHKVPTELDSVIIPSVESTGNFFPIINSEVKEIAQLQIHSGGQLNILKKGQLVINGETTWNYGLFNQGMIKVEGHLKVVNTGLIAIIDEGQIIFSQTKESFAHHFIKN